MRGTLEIVTPSPSSSHSPEPILLPLHMTTHFRWRRFSGSGLNTARTDSSKTCNKKRCDKRLIFCFCDSLSSLPNPHTYLLQSPLRQRRAFHVLDGPNFVGQLLALFPLQRRQALLRERAQCLPVFAQVNLGAD